MRGKVWATVHGQLEDGEVIWGEGLSTDLFAYSVSGPNGSTPEEGLQDVADGGYESVGLGVS